MPLEGFMLIPSKFPSWLRWTYFVPFHTYTWRSLMHNEFSGSLSGNGVLQSYEIEDTNIAHDMVVLICYSMVSETASEEIRDFICFAFAISLTNCCYFIDFLTLTLDYSHSLHGSDPCDEYKCNREKDEGIVV